MQRISITEHGRIKRLGPGVAPRAGEAELSAQQFERLQRWDEQTAAERGGELLFEWRSKEARAREYVGVVQWRDVVIEILPKVAARDEAGISNYARSNLGMMLAYANELEPEERGLVAQDHADAPLSEVFIKLFAARLRGELFRGRAQGYREVEENMGSLRGRLVFGRHVQVNAARQDRFYIRREEWSADTALNRALKAACALLVRVAAQRRTRELLGECLMWLEDVEQVAASAVRWEMVRVDRQSARFGPLLKLARLLVEGQQMTGTAGADESFSLLYPMERLYEQFVAGFIRREVLPCLNREARGESDPLFTLRTQGSGLSAYLFTEERADAPSKKTGRLKPDLMIEGPGGLRVVLDTKWKHLTQTKSRSTAKNARDGIGMADLCQMVIYGHVLGSASVLLVYPLPLDKAIAERKRTYRSVVKTADGKQDVCVSTTFLDMGLDLRDREDRAELRDVLIKALGVEEGEAGEVYGEVVRETLEEVYYNWERDPTFKKPTHVTIFGVRHPVKKWSGIVRLVAEYLAKKDANAWRAFAAQRPVGKKGGKFFSLEDDVYEGYEVGGVYISSGVSANATVINILKPMLHHFGMFNDVLVELAQEQRKPKKAALDALT
jgi:5-methylcytosine-specific restriction enzyme subunit McrC